MSRRLIPVIILVVAASLTPLAMAAGTTRYVDDNECDNETTDSVTTPYCDIQEALDDSSDGDIIEVAAGTYIETSGVFVVDNFAVDITINGAGQGVTIIDGQDARGGIRISDHDATITGLTVANAFGGGSGAGITIQNPSMTDPYPLLHLEGVTVTGANTTVSGAGVLAASRTVLEMVEVTITGNAAATGGGGGLQTFGDTTVTITDSLFQLNTADTTGGAINLGGTVAHISGSVFDQNSAGDDGGAILSTSSGDQIHISESTFTSNTTPGSGGAIWYGNGEILEVDGSYFGGNIATVGAGGAINDGTGSGTVITNSTFYDNEAGNQGGAVYTSGVIANSSFGANSAGVSGGAVSTNGWSGPKLRNTILYGNSATTSGSNCNSAVSEGYNLIGDTTGCTITGDTTGNLIAADPGWALPADNGGATFTMEIFDGSQARDAGNPDTPGSGSTTCEQTDQRGFLRSDTRCDIGAFEFGAAPQVLRYFGPNRYDTAANVSENDFPDPGVVTEVFVATGINFPDALAGAAVAGKLGAPLLLVDTGVPTATADELTRLGPDVITILGGTGTVSTGVATSLAGFAATVDRLSGANRYLTAVAISQHGFPTDGTADVVYVATGLGFADALAAGPAAVVGNGPVLLVPGTSLPAEVAAEILRLTPSRIVVVGGTAVVADAVLTALDALQDGDTVERIAGANRYATAVAISEDAFPGGAPRVYVATGPNFPDALAGAGVAGMHDSPVLLVPGTSIPAEVSTEITRLGATTVIILGGTASISTGVENDLKTLIGAT